MIAVRVRSAAPSATLASAGTGIPTAMIATARSMRATIARTSVAASMTAGLKGYSEATAGDRQSPPSSHSVAAPSMAATAALAAPTP